MRSKILVVQDLLGNLHLVKKTVNKFWSQPHFRYATYQNWSELKRDISHNVTGNNLFTEFSGNVYMHVMFIGWLVVCKNYKTLAKKDWFKYKIPESKQQKLSKVANAVLE